MIKLWLFVVAALVVQEFTSTAAALLAARNAGFNLWIVHALWLAITIFEIAIGFLAGKIVQRRYPASRVALWAKRFEETIAARVGNHGKNLFILGLSFFSFAWMAGFAASWIEIPFANVLVFSLLGEGAWYLLEWGTALGFLAVTPNFQSALVALVLAGIAITIILSFFKKKGRIMR